MTTQQQSTVPAGWAGSEATWVAYEALVKHGKRPGVDFIYRPRNQGRRMETDIEVDFTLPPDLALQIQESFYDHHSGISSRGTDVLSKAQMAGSGVTMIILNGDRLKQDPEWLIGEALQYRDHSME